jgi:hypothetical protein
MKRLIFVLSIVFLLILIAAIFIRPAITFLVRKQLEKVFIGSQVDIGSCSIIPLKQLSFFDAEIKKQDIYDFKIKEIDIDYSPLSILNRSILRFDIKDAFLNINLSQKNLSAFKSYLKLGSKSPLTLQDLELSNININLKSKDLKASLEMSVGLNLKKQLVKHLDTAINFIEAEGLLLENASLRFNANYSSPGNLNIAQIKYDKAKIENVFAKLSFKDQTLFLGALTAQIFGGRVEGDLTAGLNKDMAYAVNLNFVNLSLERFVSDFNLQEKFQMTGDLNGKVILRGSGLNINSILGNLSATETGGVLTITDKRFLENLARTQGQSLDILVESFKNYHYNIGIMKLGLDKGNLILDVSLDGEAGKRNLNIVVHDFKLRR